MNIHTPVQQLMSVNPLTVREDTPLSSVRKLLKQHSFHHVPVVTEAGILVGILSSSDLAQYALDVWVADEAAVDAELDNTFSLSAVMTHEPFTIDPSGTVRQAANILADGDFHCLPVVEADGKLLGMLTSTDLLRFFAVQTT